MKISIKIIVVFIAAITLNIIFAPLTLGVINLRSIVNYKYDLTKNFDFVEAEFFLNSQINDNAYAYLFLQYLTYTNDIDPTKLEQAYFNISTYYFTYDIKPNGIFTVGCFDNYLSSVTLSSSIDKLKSNWGVKYERPITTNFSCKIGYFPNEIYNSNPLPISDPRYPGYFTMATTAGISYSGSHCAADLSLASFSDSGQIPPAAPLSYVANFSFSLNDIFKAYLHYCRDYNEKYDAIVGIQATIPPVDTPLIFNAEYNFNDNGSGAKLFQYNVTYFIAKNISISYFRFIRTSNENELRLSIKF